MSRTEIVTIKCPTCQHDLPAWAQVCQFCGNPLKGVVRPVSGAIVDTWSDAPTWQEVCYIIVSVVFILIGAYELLQGFKVLPTAMGSKVFDGYLAYLQIMGFLSVVLGVGMLFQQLWAQFIVKWYSVLSLVSSLFGLLTSLTLASTATRVISGGLIAALVALNAAYVLFYGFTIYIIKQVGDVDP